MEKHPEEYKTYTNVEEMFKDILNEEKDEKEIKKTNSVE